MINEQVTMRGHVQAFLNGELVVDKRNLIVTVGKEFLAEALIASSTSPFTHMAIGTSGTPAAVGDTTLGAEVARAAFTTSSRTSNVVSLSTTFGAGVGTGTIQEAGIFNDPTTGTMLSHVVFSSVGKGASDILVINWTITVS